MPAKRLPWIKFWLEAIDHEKVALLDDGAFRTWVTVLAASAKQTTRWRFASVQHAAAVAHRPAEHIETLVAARLLDQRDDGLWVHDFQQWQEVYPSDFTGRDSAKAPRRLRKDSEKSPQKLRLDEEGDVRRETKTEIETETYEVVDGAGAPAAAAPGVEEFHRILTGLPGYDPSPEFLAKVAANYGRLDLGEEALKISSWLMSRPQRERQASTRFVLNWLKSAAETDAARKENGEHGNPRANGNGRAPVPSGRPMRQRRPEL